MKKTPALLILIFSTLVTFGQVDQKSWDSLKTISTDYYEFQVPIRWRQVQTGGQGPEQYLEASGLALPTTFNSSPVIVTIFFAKQQGQDLNEAKGRCLNGYRENPDREFPKNLKDGEEKAKAYFGTRCLLSKYPILQKIKGA